MTKKHLFLPILDVFTPLNDVCLNIAWSWKTTLIRVFFSRGWYPNSNKSGPPGQSVYCQFKMSAIQRSCVNTLLLNSLVCPGQTSLRSVSTIFMIKYVYTIHHVWYILGPVVITVRNSVFFGTRFNSFLRLFFITKFSVKFKAYLRKM